MLIRGIHAIQALLFVLSDILFIKWGVDIVMTTCYPVTFCLEILGLFDSHILVVYCVYVLFEEWCDCETSQK